MVEVAYDGAVPLERAMPDPPELVVLDLMIPSLDGFEVCRRLRARAPVPVIMLTARGEEADRIVGSAGGRRLRVQALLSRELTARIKAVLRGAAGSVATSGDEPTVLRAGSLEVDTVAHDARNDGDWWR